MDVLADDDASPTWFHRVSSDESDNAPQAEDNVRVEEEAEELGVYVLAVSLTLSDFVGIDAFMV